MIGDLVADRVTGHGSGAFSLQDWVRPKLVAITVSGRHLILVICGAARAGAPRPGPDGARRGLSLRVTPRRPLHSPTPSAVITRCWRCRCDRWPARSPSRGSTPGSTRPQGGVYAYPAAVDPALSAAVAHCAAATAGRH